MARYRLGSETKAVKYWKKEEEKRCRLCNMEQEDIEHILVNCEKTGSRESYWIQQMEQDRKTMTRLRNREGARRKGGAGKGRM